LLQRRCHYCHALLASADTLMAFILICLCMGTSASYRFLSVANLANWSVPTQLPPNRNTRRQFTSSSRPVLMPLALALAVAGASSRAVRTPKREATEWEMEGGASPLDGGSNRPVMH
jgi:hypothetical protein